MRLEGVEEETAYLEEKYGFEYDEQQKRAIRLAVSGGVTVVTGGPGTGKTTVIKAITDIFLKLKISFALTAPTGRAAKRMSRDPAGQEAKTVHRLLETTFNDRGEQRFARDRENPAALPRGDCGRDVDGGQLIVRLAARRAQARDLSHPHRRRRPSFPRSAQATCSRI